MSPRVRSSRAWKRFGAAAVTLLVTAGPTLVGPLSDPAHANQSSPSWQRPDTTQTAAGPTQTPFRRSSRTPLSTQIRSATRGRLLSAEVEPVSCRIVAVTPAVAVRGKHVSLTIELTNHGATTLADVSVNARLAASLPSREALRQWLREGKAPGLSPVATGRLNAAVPPNSTTTVKLSIPANRLPRDRPYGVAPLAVDTNLGARTIQRRSALPYFRIKEFEPLDLGVALPLTADPDPALVGSPGSDRERAWSRLTASDSRLARILDGSERHPVTWIVDPALVSRTAGPGLRGLGQPAQTSGDTAAPAPGPAETQLYSQLRSRLAARAADHPVWYLPGHDPDIAALVHSQVDSTNLARVLQARPPLTETLGTPTEPVIWPVGDALTESERVRVAQAAKPKTPVTFLVPSSSVDPDPDNSSGAAHQSVTGQRLLAYDDELSNQLTGMTQDSAPAELTAQFVADTALLLAQAPGRRRALFVTTARDFNPDPNALDSLLTTLSQVPWLRMTSTTSLTHPVSRGPAAETRQAGNGTPMPPPVTAAAVSSLASTRPGLEAFSAVLRQPSPAIATAADAQIALESTRWRSAPDRYPPTRAAVDRRVADLLNGVSVVPSTVNFFADSGQLQLTVVNSLDAEVADVHLTVDPAERQSRLRVLRQPDPLRIRTRSRATVRLPVEAIASGVVTLPTRLTTPEGVALGSESVVRAQVHPANGWIVLVVGAFAGIVLVTGVYRALRRGQPRVPSAALGDVDLT